MEFEGDERKAVANLRKRGVSFAEAATVFGDAMAITYPDPDHSEMEDRWLTFGYYTANRLLVVAHTQREERTRIITARRATSGERRIYEES